MRQLRSLAVQGAPSVRPALSPDRGLSLLRAASELCHNLDLPRSRDPKPNLLLATRQLPASTGSGTPMRLAMNLEALSHFYRVHLLVVPEHGAPNLDHMPAELRDRVVRVASVRTAGREDPAFRDFSRPIGIAARLKAEQASELTYFTRFATPEVIRDAGAVFADVTFDVVHASRLYMAPYVEPYLRSENGRRPHASLDMDDFESRTRGRIAELAEQTGEPVRAAFETLCSEKCEDLERTWLPRFDDVWVCSEVDRAAIARAYRHNGVRIVPNAVRMPSNSEHKRPGGTFTLLFVGNMAYFPNAEAACRLAHEVLPELSRRASRPVRLVIAGKYSTPEVEELGRIPKVELLGEVPELASVYRATDVALAPLRAGGGTRIKILEAFSHRRPVVASRMGAEGLEVAHGREILLADSSSRIAGACLQLMENPGEAQSLAERAFQWVRSHHSPAQVRDAIGPPA